MVFDPKEIPHLDKSGLRRFGLTTGGIVAILFGILLPFVLDHSWPLWPWLIAAALAVWALAAPTSLGPVYRGWMRFGLVVGRIMTPVILTLVYIVTFIPTSIILWLLGRDMMRRKFDAGTSYRVKSKQPSVANMEKPF